MLTNTKTVCPAAVATLPPEVRDLAQPVQFARNTHLYWPSSTPREIYILGEGFVKVGGYDEAGAETVYDVIGPGEFCGNLAYLGGGRFQEFARAVTDVAALGFDLDRFKEVFRSRPLVHDWFVRLMVSRWARAEARLYRNSAFSAERRLRTLVDELRDQGLDARAALSQTDLGQLTGLTRQTVARVLRQMPAEINQQVI